MWSLGLSVCCAKKQDQARGFVCGEIVVRGLADCWLAVVYRAEVKCGLLGCNYC